jgi:hypothetical protein
VTNIDAGKIKLNEYPANDAVTAWPPEGMGQGRRWEMHGVYPIPLQVKKGAKIHLFTPVGAGVFDVYQLSNDLNGFSVHFFKVFAEQTVFDLVF